MPAGLQLPAAPPYMPAAPQLMTAAPEFMPAGLQLMPAEHQSVPTELELMLEAPKSKPEEPQQQLGVQTNAAMPSPGSELHAQGTCTPCAWFWKPQGCKNSSSCGRCHLCGPSEVKLRKKAKMAAMSAKAEEVKQEMHTAQAPQLLIGEVSAPASMFIAPNGALILD
mmetsp:Transcript_26692/g.48274  ORF Transcript_26692/g.48274 Transcript_26692/m.48274 type:complete len:167 (+) Transcript_26692:3-503(+)